MTGSARCGPTRKSARADWKIRSDSDEGKKIDVQGREGRDVGDSLDRPGWPRAAQKPGSLKLWLVVHLVWRSSLGLGLFQGLIFLAYSRCGPTPRLLPRPLCLFLAYSRDCLDRWVGDNK